jgi:hypothetical protein
VAESWSAVFWFTIAWAPTSTLSALSPRLAARSLRPAAWLPMTTRSCGSFCGASPGLNATAASPTKPTATISAVASTRGVIRSGRLTSTSTFPTSTSRIRSTLPTETPEIFTTELILRLPASLNWTFHHLSSSAATERPLSQVVPTTNSTIARITRLPTVTSCL